MSKFYMADTWGGSDVYCVTGNKRRKINLRNDLYNWSKFVAWGTFSLPAANQLALAVLADHLKNDVEAMRYYGRFKHRVVAMQGRDRQFMVTEEEIDAAMNAMRTAEREMRPAVQRVNREQPIPMNEGGPGVEWDRVDRLRPNKPED